MDERPTVCPRNLHDLMITTKQSRTLPSFGLILLAAFVAALLSSCATTTQRPPSPGKARFDATPDAERRDRIDGIGILSVNGDPTKGSEVELSPGRNRVRVGFSWPQGGKQEVDLDFKARAGITYIVYYDVYPPVSRHPGAMEKTTTGLVSARNTDAYSAMVTGIFAGFMTPFAAAEKAVRVSTENAATATYVDVMAVAQQSPEGVVCNRRVYPNGKVEKR